MPHEHYPSGDSYVGNRYLRTRDSGVDGLHIENLFDLDERTDGTSINEWTGEQYDNSTETHESPLLAGYDDSIGQIIDLETLAKEEALPAKPDAADLWLAEHDK